MGYLIVFIGAGMGGMARHGVNVAAVHLFGASSFPFGTLFINIVGSLLMGYVVEYFAFRSGLAQTKICGVRSLLMGSTETQIVRPPHILARHIIHGHDRWPLRTRRRCRTFWRDRSRPACGRFHTRHRPDDILARAHANPADRDRTDVCGAGCACRLLRDIRSIRPHHNVRSLAAGLRCDRRGLDRADGLGAACGIPACRTERARKTGTVVGAATQRPKMCATPSRSPWLLIAARPKFAIR